tara:strand:+ start:163 stop:1104 length:942 start_codon:yes stop_codon:yes gene_type:complete
MSKLTKLKGDASFRSFFRKKENGNSTIIVYAKKEKFRNLLVYDAINKIFIKNKILAPKLYSQKYKKNSIEIEDFGDQTIFKILKKKNSNKLRYFKQIIKLLIQIQSIKSRKVKNFRNRNYSIPKYKKNILINEANLFCDWYVKKNLSKSKGKKFSKNFRKIVKNLAFGLKLKDDILVHRDFHVSNLILVNNQIGIIDSQDALIGNRAYDLASLIDDVRLKTSISIKKKILNLYFKKQKKIDIKKLINDFEILSILRNLKIIGIFTRLAVRDGKKNYLKLIPYAWELINMRIHQNHAFIDLRNLLIQNFKKKIK